jgi:hypothetical protein
MAARWQLLGMQLLVTGDLPFANGIVGLGRRNRLAATDILHVESEIVEITPARVRASIG